MSILPSQLASNLFYINGSPLNLDNPNLKHLKPIYNKPSNSILLKFGRQSHKSSTIGMKIVLPCVKYSNFHALYVAPTSKQTSVFSSDKLHSTIRGSDVIRKNYLDTTTTDQIFYKEFNNNSKIYLRSSFGNSADSIRGTSSDIIAFDEIQDQNSGAMSQISQCSSHSIAKYDEMSSRIKNLPAHIFNSKIYAGTPKTIENNLEHMWALSTSNEWIIKCLSCGKQNYINEQNVGLTCLICNKCGKPIYYENGQWISMNPTGFIDGYRLPQIVLNWVSNRNNPRAWQTNVIEVQKQYSSEQFYNEVLALPFANAKNPLSPEDLKRVCKDYSMIDCPDESSMLKKATVIVAGIDWGHGNITGMGTSYSIISIGAIIEGRFKLIFMKRYTGKMSDPIVQIDDMISLIYKYHVHFTIADFGDGRVSNALLTQKLSPQNFAQMYEHGSISKKISWNGDKGYYTINRTGVMTDLFTQIKNDQVDFFNYEQFGEFKLDFLNIYSEYSYQTRMTRYDHVSSDDSFHSYMYSRLAAMIINGELSKYLGAGADASDDGNDNAISL